MSGMDVSPQASAEIVVPIPQHMCIGSAKRPLGPVVLILDGGADPWAVTTLRQGLTGLGLPEPLTEPPAGEHTTVTLTTSAAVGEDLLRRCRAEFGAECTFERLTCEGYMLEVHEEGQTTRVTIAGVGGAGLAYGADTFLQLIDTSGSRPMLPQALIFDYPAVPIRVYGGSGTLDQAASMRYNNMRGGAQIEEMRLRHIEPWVTVHPSHASAGQPGLCYSDSAAVERAIAPILEAAGRGVRWVGMNFDDIDLKLGHPADVEKYGTIGKAQAAFINHALTRVRAANRECRLTVIPIVYANNWLPGTWVYAVDEAEIYDYLETLGREVDPSVVFIWTGESVESISMTDEDIEQWTRLVRRKPIIFENTPTGDLTDFGPLRFRTRNIGDLIEGWIYIHRGPQAQIAELSTAEYLWNPRAYDPEAALRRALRRLVAPEAASHMEKLVASFSAKWGAGPDGKGPRYRHPLWREGRLLEVVEPDDPEIADFYVERLETISKTIPELDALIWENPLYQAIRKVALANVDVARTYLETYTMIRFAERGELAEACAAGDRAEALFEEWNRYSSGSTDLNAPTERRDAMTYIEQVGVPQRLRALRRGGDAPIPWLSAGQHATRLGRTCSVLSEPNDRVQMKFKTAAGSLKWLVLTACGAPDAPVRLEVNGQGIPMPDRAWATDRWRSVAFSLAPGQSEYVVTLAAMGPTDWAIARAALLEDPLTTRLLHATRSSAAFGDASRTTSPTRLLRAVATPQVTGRVAVRADLSLVRGVSGQFFDLAPGVVLGQTFHLPATGEQPLPPEDPIRLKTRESSDGDFLHSIGIMFQQQGATPLAMSLWRWAGSVWETTAEPGNRIASSVGHAGTAFGPSHHWVEFPFGVELDLGATYYLGLTAPEGWEGWRLRQSYGWYGCRSDPTRSAYRNGEMLRSADIPFRTYVCDVYDAEWRR